MSGRYDIESSKSLHAPFQKPISGVVALDFHIQIELQGIRAAKVIHLHGMIDDQIHGNQGLDNAGAFPHPFNGRPHGGKIDQQRNAGKILQQDARDHEGHFVRPHRLRAPVRQFGDVFFTYAFAVAVAQYGFQQDADTEGQPGNRPHALLFQLRQGIEFARSSARNGELLQRVE